MSFVHRWKVIKEASNDWLVGSTHQDRPGRPYPAIHVLGPLCDRSAASGLCGDRVGNVNQKGVRLDWTWPLPPFMTVAPAAVHIGWGPLLFFTENNKRTVDKAPSFGSGSQHL